MKRIFLFMATNIAIMITLSIVLKLAFEAKTLRMAVLSGKSSIDMPLLFANLYESWYSGSEVLP